MLEKDDPTNGLNQRSNFDQVSALCLFWWEGLKYALEGKILASFEGHTIEFKFNLVKLFFRFFNFFFHLLDMIENTKPFLNVCVATA